MRTCWQSSSDAGESNQTIPFSHFFFILAPLKSEKSSFFTRVALYPCAWVRDWELLQHSPWPELPFSGVKILWHVLTSTNACGLKVTFTSQTSSRRKGRKRWLTFCACLMHVLRMSDTRSAHVWYTFCACPIHVLRMSEIAERLRHHISSLLVHTSDVIALKLRSTPWTPSPQGTVDVAVEAVVGQEE